MCNAGVHAQAGICVPKLHVRKMCSYCVSSYCYNINAPTTNFFTYTTAGIVHVDRRVLFIALDESDRQLQDNIA